MDQLPALYSEMPGCRGDAEKMSNYQNGIGHWKRSSLRLVLLVEDGDEVELSPAA
jgi:hypothetical protein